jgi:hypothetical protein
MQKIGEKFIQYPPGNKEKQCLTFSYWRFFCDLLYLYMTKFTQNIFYMWSRQAKLKEPSQATIGKLLSV